jgi:hypothetical protein
VGQLLETVELVRANLNPELEISTVLLTMYDARTRLSAAVADEVRAHFGERVLSTLIPRSVRVSEAPSFGQSVIAYDPFSPGALSYLEAAREIAERGAVPGKAAPCADETQQVAEPVDGPVDGPVAESVDGPVDGPAAEPSGQAAEEAEESRDATVSAAPGESAESGEPAEPAEPAEPPAPLVTEQRSAPVTVTVALPRAAAAAVSSTTVPAPAAVPAGTPFVSTPGAPEEGPA